MSSCQWCGADLSAGNTASFYTTANRDTVPPLIRVVGIIAALVFGFMGLRTLFSGLLGLFNSLGIGSYFYLYIPGIMFYMLESLKSASLILMTLTMALIGLKWRSWAAPHLFLTASCCGILIILCTLFSSLVRLLLWFRMGYSIVLMAVLVAVTIAVLFGATVSQGAVAVPPGGVEAIRLTLLEIPAVISELLYYHNHHHGFSDVFSSGTAVQIHQRPVKASAYETGSANPSDGHAGGVSSSKESNGTGQTPRYSGPYTGGQTNQTPPYSGPYTGGQTNQTPPYSGPYTGGQANQTPPYSGPYTGGQTNRTPPYSGPYTGGYTGGTPPYPSGAMRTDRSLLTYILLTIITCGIYGFYFLYCLARDINIICAGDGKKTAGLLQLVLLSIVTCGIYSYYWHYSIGNRLAENAPRYGLQFMENGTTVLLWLLLGWLLCGIGSYVGLYIILRNLNDLSAAYNRYYHA